MAMTNTTFWKLVHEWEINMNYNDEFKKFVIPFINSGELPESVKWEFSALRQNLEHQLVKDFKKLKKYPWLKDSDDVDLYIDLMPMGGYKDYSKIIKALKK